MLSLLNTQLSFLLPFRKEWIKRPPGHREGDKYKWIANESHAMIGEGVNYGDKLLCRTTFEVSQIKEGDLVCAQPINEYPIIRRIYYCDNQIVLMTANRIYPPQAYYKNELIILGIIVDHDR